MEALEMLTQAVLFLINSCDGCRSQDGKGFDRTDLYKSRGIKAEIEENGYITENSLIWAKKVVVKYHRQLTNFDLKLMLQAEKKPRKIQTLEYDSRRKHLCVIYPCGDYRMYKTPELPESLIEEAREIWRRAKREEIPILIFD